MKEKEHVIKMINRLKTRVDGCDQAAAILIKQTMEFIEDSFNDGDISKDDFVMLRGQVGSLSSRFARECGCHKGISAHDAWEEKRYPIGWQEKYKKGMGGNNRAKM